MTNSGNIGRGNRAEAIAQAVKYGSANFGGTTITRLSRDSKDGDRVVFLDKKNSPLGVLREGTVESSEWASAFNATYFVLRLDDGTTARVLVQ